MSYIEDLREIWELVKVTLRDKYPESFVNLWFGELKVSDYDLNKNVVTISTESEMKYNIIKEKYLDELEEGFSEQFGFPTNIELVFTGDSSGADLIIKRVKEMAKLEAEKGFVPKNIAFELEDIEKIRRGELKIEDIKPDEDSDYDEDEDEYEGDDEDDDGVSEETSDRDDSDDEDFDFFADRESNENSEKSLQSILPVNYNFEYTFDNFVVGNSNKFAHAACTAVADSPASNYNPLFIYGPSGLGKTHLMSAVVNEIKRKKPNIRVVYIKGDEFTNEMIESLAKHSMKKFHNKYRNCDILLIDDVQFIAGKESTQEEFFHTFNTLYEERKQIILSSDRPPKDIQTLEERLKTRFEWGLIADIQPPDLELRIAIIKKKAEQVNVDIPNEVLTYLAENLRSNIRQIEGAIKRLSALDLFYGTGITMEMAKSCIAEFLGEEEPLSITIDKIFAAVYRRYDIPKEDLIGTKRSKDIAAARHLTIYLMRNITDMSLKSIGNIFNGRDHTTIKSSCELMQRKIAMDPQIKLAVAELTKEIQS